MQEHRRHTRATKQYGKQMRNNSSTNNAKNHLGFLSNWNKELQHCKATLLSMSGRRAIHHSQQRAIHINDNGHPSRCKTTVSLHVLIHLAHPSKQSTDAGSTPLATHFTRLCPKTSRVTAHTRSRTTYQTPPSDVTNGYSAGQTLVSTSRGERKKEYLRTISTQIQLKVVPTLKLQLGERFQASSKE